MSEEYSNNTYFVTKCSITKLVAFLGINFTSHLRLTNTLSTENYGEGKNFWPLILLNRIQLLNHEWVLCVRQCQSSFHGKN